MQGRVFFAISPRDSLRRNLGVLSPISGPACENLGLQAKKEMANRSNIFNTLEDALTTAHTMAKAPDFPSPDDYTFFIFTDGEGNTRAIERLLEEVSAKAGVYLVTVGPNGGKNAQWLNTLRNRRIILAVAGLGDEASRLAQSAILGGMN